MINLKVSVAQINVQLGDLSVNLNTHQGYIEQAAALGSQVLLFPELSLTGYQIHSSIREVAMKRDDTRLKALAQLAPHMSVIVGFVEKAGPGEYYNAMAWLLGGSVVAVHRKVNLPTYGGLEEGKWFHSGKATTSVSHDEHWRGSVLICADLWNPPLVHCALLERPELLLAPINSASNIVSKDFCSEENWLINIKFYAVLYATPVLMANRCGPEAEAKFWGGSCILSPSGEVLAQAKSGEALITANLSLDDIDKARLELPTLRDANTPLITTLLSKRQN